MRDSHYFLTVFTPTYNRADKLHRVYNSIKKQTLQKIDDEYIFEWIIVDDGSSDNTKELVQKWQNESDFEIRYFYQENKGKPSASRKGIEEAKSELFLFCDSDDEFMPETFETFYGVWQDFSDKEREKCGGIGVLCQDQYGKRVGCDFPMENKLLPIIDVVFKWKNLPLGETWAIIKTKNLKYAFLNVPQKIKKLKFVPESFFWDRIAFELDTYSYPVNKVLRIYYKQENDNISENIRDKYPEGFLFESKYFIKYYKKILFINPKLYIKHLIKFIYFSVRVNA